MKKNNILFVLLPCIVLMISCLGDGSHVVQYLDQKGVVSVETEETFIFIEDGKKILPSNNKGSLGNEECVLINYNVDLDDYQRDGFYQVELVSNPIIVKSHEMEELSDTTQMLLNEKLINAFDSDIALIKNKLFLSPFFIISDSLTVHNFYKMSYDKDQAPIKDPDLNNIDVYKLYLRVQLDSIVTASKTGDSGKIDRNAFDIEEFLSDFASKIPADSTNMYIRIRCAHSFNSDATVNWIETPSFAIPVK